MGISSALIEGFRTFPQRQRRNTIVLGDYNIASLTEIDQRYVYVVSARAVSGVYLI